MNLPTLVSNAISTASQFVGQFTSPVQANQDKPFAFSFGDPEPVLNRNDWSWLQSYPSPSVGYFMPPIDFHGVAGLMDANAYHGSILHLKKNLILKWANPSAFISQMDLERAALDFVVTGNLYLQRLTNRFGNTVRLAHQPALYTYRGIDMTGDTEFYVRVNPIYNTVSFNPDEIVHLLEPDIKQSIYGKPQYFGGVQSVLLSEASTLFRRKYFVNGSHLGYILVANDANFDAATAKAIEEQIKAGKGAGNFRSLFLNIPRSQSREPIKVIPIGQIGTNDEFQAISEVSEMAMLAMHRMPAQLAAIMPANTGGFGDAMKTLQLYHELEIEALQNKFLQLNELVGKEVISFRKPEWTLV
jgi:PBSX family phage portal protein